MNVLILAGGSGTRFWPLSRQQRPKQFLPLGHERSLLQQTVDRVIGRVGAENVWICTTELLADQCREQVPEIPAENVLAEPTGRNTAPAIGWSLLQMPEAARSQAVAVLPSDHWMARPEDFVRALDLAAKEVQNSSRVMTLGVVPRWAETGYGYLELGRETAGDLEVLDVRRFTEKPDAPTAESFFGGGRHLWNAGIFLFRADLFLGVLEKHQPEMYQGLLKIAEASDSEEIRALYSALPAESIDTGVMEPLSSAAEPPGSAIGTVPLDCGWSDLGSWEAMTELLGAREDGNFVKGEVLAVDSTNNLLVADEGTIAVLGVEGLAVVRTGDTVLVMPREKAQDVRKIVQELKEKQSSLL